LAEKQKHQEASAIPSSPPLLSLSRELSIEQSRTEQNREQSSIEKKNVG